MLTIKNTFGNVSIEGVSSSLTTNLKFCTTIISESAARCNLSLNYGSTKMTNLSNDVEIISKHTTLDLANIQGKLKIDSDYGKTNLKPGEKPKSIILKGNKTEVDIELQNRPTFGINITSKDTKLNLPNFLESLTSKDTKSHFLYKGSVASKLQVDTYLGSLIIK